MKKIFLNLFLVCCLVNFAQTNENVEEDYERIYVEFGEIIPIGNLNKQFDTSLHYGFWFRTKMKQNNFMDIGFNFYIPKNAQSIEVFKKGAYLTFESTKFTFALGGRLNKVFTFSKNVNVEWISGFGVKFLTYNTPNTLILTEEEKENKEGNIIFLPYVSQGIRWNYKNVGLQANFHIGETFGTIKPEENIGNSFLTFGIVYRQ